MTMMAKKKMHGFALLFTIYFSSIMMFWPVRATGSVVVTECDPKVECWVDGHNNSQPYIAAYMATDYLEEPQVAIYADGVRLTVSFLGTDKSVIQSDNFLMAGLAAQGQSTQGGENAIDWGYFFTLCLDGSVEDPFFYAQVVKGHEWVDGRPGYPETVESWTFGLQDVLTINSQVTLSMTWTPSTLEYDAEVDGTNWHLFSYVPESSAVHSFLTGVVNREYWIFPLWGTVKLLQFVGACSLYNIGSPGWQSHLSNPAIMPISTGTHFWKYVPFAFSTDGEDAYWDNTIGWGGNPYPRVDITHAHRRVSFHATASESILPKNTLVWYLLTGDINGDSTVDIFDAISLASAFNSEPGDANWNPDADIDYAWGSGIVDIYDAIWLGAHYGQSEFFDSGGEMGDLGSSGYAMVTGGGTANILIDPCQITAYGKETFAVHVKLENAVDLAGWEFALYWNSAILNCTSVAVQEPAEWQNNTQNYGSGLEANYNSTHARYWKAQTASYPAPPFNGSMTIATLTFQALQPGTTSLTLVETKLGNSTAQPIDHTDSSGSVTVYYGRYMRSDTKSVNGLNAYLLNATETTSYQDAGNANSGRNAYWGIRAWIRHANGVEQEITLDGQTGTPKAVVARGSGSGMLSATTSVSQSVLQTTDSLVVRVYFRTSGSSWGEVAAFTTEQLGSTTLTGCSWTVYYYTWAQYYKEGGYTAGHFYWGSPARNSRIQNLQYS